MRVLYVWFTAIICMGIVTLGWYICNDVVLSIVNNALADATGKGLSLVILIEYVAAWWGPFFDIIILLWAIVNSQEVDPTSAIFR